MPRPEGPVDTQTFPVLAYSFVDTADGVGDIRVQP
jgi:hypothetical protein